MISLRLSVLTCILVTGLQISNCVHNKNPVPLAKLGTCKEFDIESKQCQHFFPIENLRNYESDKYKLHLKLYVMTTNDANIVLSNGKTGKNKVEYVAVVGGYANTYSWLRTNGENVGLDSRKTDILAPLWPVPLVVTQTHDGLLEVAVPNEVDPLLKAEAKDLDVMSVCIYAWNAPSRWFYNCIEDEDFLDIRVGNRPGVKLNTTNES